MLDAIALEHASGRRISTRPRCGSTRCRSSGEIVELAAGTGWWSPLLAPEGRAVDLRRLRRSPWTARDRCSGPRPARAHPHSRRVGRAGSPGRCRVLRRLAEPRSSRSAWRSSWRSCAAGSSPAACSRSSMKRVDRSFAETADETRATRVSTTAGNSRSSRSTTSRRSSRRRSCLPASPRPTSRRLRALPARTGDRVSDRRRRCVITTPLAPANTTTGICARAATAHGPDADTAWTRRAGPAAALARRPAHPRRDRRARGGHRLVVAAARSTRRAVALRRELRSRSPSPRNGWPALGLTAHVRGPRRLGSA